MLISSIQETAHTDGSILNTAMFYRTTATKLPMRANALGSKLI